MTARRYVVRLAREDLEKAAIAMFIRDGGLLAEWEFSREENKDAYRKDAAKIISAAGISLEGET